MPPEREDLIIDRLDRVDTRLDRMEGKMDTVVGCVNDRVTWEAHDRYKSEHAAEHERLTTCIGELSKALTNIEKLIFARPAWYFWLIVVSLAVTVTYLFTRAFP